LSTETSTFAQASGDREEVVILRISRDLRNLIRIGDGKCGSGDRVHQVDDLLTG
jgi:hypothetical protein